MENKGTYLQIKCQKFHTRHFGLQLGTRNTG